MKLETFGPAGENALQQGAPRSQTAFTLVEVMIAMAIIVVSLAGVIAGYIVATRQAEWSAYSLAAQSLATQRFEQTRASKWDPRAWPAVDELTAANFPTVPTNILDMPVSGTNVAYATNFTTITDVSSGGYPLRMIRVDCVWSFRQRPFTNTFVAYRAPDQ
jgi:prepilin-type N-terminal cleavage/methylation domain-containing protein